MPSVGKIPKSRINKSQISAHLDTQLADRLKIYCKRNDLSLTEGLALAVNLRASDYGRGAILRVTRERLIFRNKSPAQERDKVPECRTGKKRIAASFHRAEVECLRAFCREIGVPQERLIEEGVLKLLSATSLMKGEPLSEEVPTTGVSPALLA
jgi:hypothetical protein